MFFFHVLLSLLFSVRILAGPLVSRAVTSEELSRLEFYSEYAKSALCNNNNDPGSSPLISCAAGKCPKLAAAGATSLVEFRNLGYVDATGYVAVDHTNQLLIVSFRGTSSIGGALADVNIVLMDWNLCPGCKVHSGFYDSWKKTKPTIKAALDPAIQQWPSYKLAFVGHSLGAAVATLCAADLRASGYDGTMYNYGSPMVGNVKLANFITNQGKNYRVTHQTDPVPKLPGYPIGYGHVSPEYWIKSGEIAPVTESDIAVSYGTVNLAGNQGTLISDFIDHLYYFGNIIICDIINLPVDLSLR